MYIKSIWSNELLKDNVSLLIFLSGWPIYWWKWGIKVLLVVLVYCYFFFWVGKYLLYISRCFYVGKYLKCYILLLDCPLYQYVIISSLFIVFVLKSILPDLNTPIPAFFWFQFAWKIFYRPFTFSLCDFTSEVSLL